MRPALPLILLGIVSGSALAASVEMIPVFEEPLVNGGFGPPAIEPSGSCLNGTTFAATSNFEKPTAAVICKRELQAGKISRTTQNIVVKKGRPVQLGCDREGSAIFEFRVVWFDHDNNHFPANFTIAADNLTINKSSSGQKIIINHNMTKTIHVNYTLGQSQEFHDNAGPAGGALAAGLNGGVISADFGANGYSPTECQ